MPETVLRTKLFIPPLRPNLIPRPHLIEKLNQGLQLGGKLSLVSAPAGFGKTTLVCEWVTGSDRPAAWLSLDEGDNDLTRFLTYLIAALNQLEGVETAIGRGTLGMLQSPQPPPAEAILTSLVNDVAANPERIILVLDDYHLIDSSPIDDALTFLLKRLPLQLHLAIATREDPQLPLSRLRARGQLTELRATDLRFTSFEAAEFLNEAMGLALSEEDIRTLETHTEGWIAGLQLAAISLRGKEDTTKLIRSFSGSHRLVLDYLIEEVLDQQNESVRTFLLQTAILNRFTGSLCDALTGQNNGQATLEMLERANLFIVPLDEERRWYRYHHLFADLLQAHLRNLESQQVSTLHRLAGKWYEEQGLMAEGLHHFLAVEDFQQAGRLLEEVGAATMWKQANLGKIQYWLEIFPQDEVKSRPKLCLLSAWALYASGQIEAIESFLQSAESHLQDDNGELVFGTDLSKNTPEVPSEAPSLSKDGQSIMAEVLAIRAFVARVHDDMPRAIELFRQSLELLSSSSELHLRAVITGGLADAYFMSGNILAAAPLFSEASAVGWESNNIYMATFSARRLAEVQMMQGYLGQAAETCQYMQQQLSERSEQEAAVAGNAYIVLAELMCEWNDLKAAVKQLEECIVRGKQGANPRILLPSYVALTRALQGLGDTVGARSTIREALHVWQKYKVSQTWSVPSVPTYQARLWIAQGNIASANQWAREQGLHADAELSYRLEVDHITLARLLIAQGKVNEAARLLQRLLETAEAGGRISRVIEILILQALSLQTQNYVDQATATLERALTLSEPGGFVRIFVDEGRPMVDLLYEALNRGIAPDYVRRLLAAFPIDEPARADLKEAEADQSQLIEPLTERELEVLQLIAQGLTNREIAARLYLSLNTVKVHTRTIYSKLDVHSRTQAIARSQELGLLRRRSD